MENLGSLSGNGEDNLGIPDDLRCKRSDGKQWRCTAKSMPDKTVCEKHYIQAKKRAANSAQRASMRKAQRKAAGEDSDIFLDNQDDDLDASLSNNTRDGDSLSTRRNRDNTTSEQHGYSSDTSMMGISARVTPEGDDDDTVYDFENEEDPMSRRTFSYPSLDSGRDAVAGACDSNGMEYSEDGATESSEDVGAHPCHQCRKKNKNGLVCCLRCGRRGYCFNCISTRYSDFSREELEKLCPACRGICFCRSCIHTDNVVKVRLREIPIIEKLQYLYCLLSAVLPVVKRIHHDQCIELELEKKLRGGEIELFRTKLNADEQMCCNICSIPIIDYHRHCTNCLYDVCLQCCQDLRATSTLASETQTEGNIELISSANGSGLLSRTKLDLSVKYPLWKINNNGSIPCPPKDYGGCGHSLLSLSRILKMNWVAKLVKVTEEMVMGCKLKDSDAAEQCSQTNASSRQDSWKECESGNFLYCPSLEDVKSDGILKFRKHWARNEPVIVTEVFNSSLMSSWDPMAIWKEIIETADEKTKKENRLVKVINYVNGSEVDIELAQFIDGYSEGHLCEDGELKMLKVKDWPSPILSEEFLLYHRPEFFSRVPLLEYIHSKHGILNVAAKLPHYSLQNNAGPKIYLSYGTYNELGRGDAVTNLHLKMRDMVYLLMHTNEVKQKQCQGVYSSDAKSILGKVCPSDGDTNDVPHDKEIIQNQVKLIDGDDEEMQDDPIDHDVAHNDYARSEDKVDGCRSFEGTKDASHDSSHSLPGIRWDVFQRQDVPKLIQYLQKFSNKINSSALASNESATYVLFKGILYLDSTQKKDLKEEFGVEPWSFEQSLGQAVFIPAGCPFQARNLQSTVQLGLNFLSPESFVHAATLADQIRCLPNDCDAKLQVLEVGKISLYAASMAIKEVQKLVLDPKLSKEIGFEDPNLTTPVSELLQVFANQGELSCP